MSHHANKKRPTRRPKQVDAAYLEAAALSYLDRFDATASKLRQVLMNRVRNELRKGAVSRKAEQSTAADADDQPPPLRQPSAEQIRQWVEELLDRYQRSGVLDDARFARSTALGLRGRGSSRRAIAFKLRAKGVAETLIDDAIASADTHADGDSEVEAARRFTRRRRLGPHRPEAQREPNRQKDLAALARAGFSFDVARSVLGSGDDSDF